jgi:hypothetical protein
LPSRAARIATGWRAEARLIYWMMVVFEVLDSVKVLFGTNGSMTWYAYVTVTCTWLPTLSLPSG